MLLAASAGTFNAADFVILGLLLIFLIIGISKGFLEQIIGVLSFVISFALAYFLCETVSGIICDSTGVEEAIAGWLAGVLDIEETSVAIGQISESVAALSLPEFVKTAILGYVETLSESVIDLSAVASLTVARYVITALSFIVLYIVGKLVCLLLKVILRTLVNSTPLVVIDRLLGLILGVAKGVILVFFLFFLVEILPFDFLNDVRATVDASQVANFLEENNILLDLIEKIKVF